VSKFFSNKHRDGWKWFTSNSRRLSQEVRCEKLFRVRLKYRRRCWVIVIMRPSGYFVGRNSTLGAIWVTDPWANATSMCAAEATEVISKANTSVLSLQVCGVQAIRYFCCEKSFWLVRQHVCWFLGFRIDHWGDRCQGLRRFRRWCCHKRWRHLEQLDNCSSFSYLLLTWSFSGC